MLVNTAASAPKAVLECNTFYAGIEKLAVEQATAIEALKTFLVEKDQEIQSRDIEIQVLMA
jgi:hypothetical protein